MTWIAFLQYFLKLKTTAHLWAVVFMISKARTRKYVFRKVVWRCYLSEMEIINSNNYFRQVRSRNHISNYNRINRVFYKYMTKNISLLAMYSMQPTSRPTLHFHKPIGVVWAVYWVGYGWQIGIYSGLWRRILEEYIIAHSWDEPHSTGTLRINVKNRNFVTRLAHLNSIDILLVFLNFYIQSRICS